MKKHILLNCVICVLILFTGQTVFGVQYFDSSLGYSVGSSPIGIISADLNGDTYPDIVTANNALSTVSVLLGNGDGTFATGVNYSTGASQYPYYVDIGDMDGDRNLDIITGGNAGIVIFYGVGDGTFGTANVYSFGETVNDIVVADFNNDSYLDIATSHAVRDSVGIHINNHDSTYSTHFVATGYGTISLAKGNLDSDNYIDLLVGCSNGTVWQLTNDQTGSFIPYKVHIGTLSDPASVALSDINGDNKLDFAVTHSINDFLFTYLKTNDTSYAVDQAYILADNPTSIDFADVNGDNEVDILVIIGTTNEIQLYLNQGSGIFSFDTSYTIGGKPKDLVFADFDLDGYQDIAATSYTTNQVGVLINRLSLILSVDDIYTDGFLPKDFYLEQNYPNPFNPDTKIRFSLPVNSKVKVEVFNILGQLVKVLVDEYLQAGVKEVSWNGVNASGQAVTSGLYLYRIVTDKFTQSKMMVLLK